MTCPACGRTPPPQPSDWLTADEARLVGFLAARYAEHRVDVEEYTTGPARVVAIAAADLTAVAQSLVYGYAWTSNPDRREVLWLSMVMLTQPWSEHPDFDPAWRDALTPQEA